MEALRPADPVHIGPFEVLARLGYGGMGRVYLGSSPGGRRVAIKVIREDISEYPEMLARFRREVAALRSVHSVFTANVIDASLETSPFWLATDYVPGPTLREASREPLPSTLCVNLFAALAEALNAVHHQGVIHRDLKPNNVILSPDGPKLIDFGIALADGNTQLTQTGQALGTAGFMAPEVLVGDTAGPQADIFALGATIASAATGRPPYGSGQWQAVSYRVVHGDVDVDGVDSELAQLIRDCTARNPEGRPPLTEIVRRCQSRVVLADDPDYQRVAASTVEVPLTRRTASMDLSPPADTKSGTTTVSVRPHEPVETRVHPSSARRRTAFTVALTFTATILLGFAAVQWWPRNLNTGKDAQQAATSATGTTTSSVSLSTTTTTTTIAPTTQPVLATSSAAARRPRMGAGFLTSELWSPTTDYCLQPPEERTQFEFQFAVSPDPTTGTVSIGFRDKFGVLGASGQPYLVAAAVRPPDAQRGNSSSVPAFVTATRDLSIMGTDWLEVTYPRDFPGAIPITKQTGAWTVVFYHVNNPQDYGSIACYGFTTP